MNWITLIIISIIFYSIGVLIQRKLLKNEGVDPVTHSIFFQLLTGLFITLYALVVNKLTLPNLSTLLPNVALLMFLYGIGNVFQFKALKVTQASTFVILFSTRALFTIAASTIFLHEGLGLSQWIGALFIFIGVALVTLKKNRLSIKGKEWLPLVAAAFFGLANTNDKILLTNMDLFPYLIMAFTLPAIFISVIFPASARKIPTLLNWVSFRKMTVLSLVFTVSAICFFAALQLSPNSSQVATINLLNIVLIVILSIIFLKERDNIPKKLLGTVSSLVGLLLVSG